MLITHGTILTFDQENRILYDGALCIQGAHITQVGPTAELCQAYPLEERLDAEGMLVMPGMISAHHHFFLAFARGSLPERPRARARLHQIEAALTYEDIRYSTLLDCLQAIRRGTTTIFDQHSSSRAIPYSLDAIAEAALHGGMRVCLSYAVSDQEGLTKARQGIQENARFAREAREEPILSAAMGIQSACTASAETLQLCVGAAAVAKIGFHVNVAPEASELLECQKQGTRAIDRLRRHGILGPRTVAAHCIHIVPHEIGTLQRTGTWVVDTPRENIRDYGRPLPILDLCRQGASLCLGSGTFCPNIFGELQMAHLSYKEALGSQPQLDHLGLSFLRANAALATRTFGEKIGELSPGALADVILVRYSKPQLISPKTLPLHLFNFDDGWVDTVIIHGRLVLRHGELLTLDEEAIIARAQELAQQLWSRL
ncbi:MAG: amidohydrolase family protein [Anaerolineae bacterium]|nr:amidohydrolase family protein [Anaerolineae bacterium]